MDPYCLFFYYTPLLSRIIKIWRKLSQDPLTQQLHMERDKTCVSSQ